MTAAITGIFTYPIKSCRGIAHERAQLAATGFEDDRHWMLVRPNGRFVTQRELPRLALVGTQLTPTSLALTAPGMPTLEVSRDALGPALAVTVWKFDGRGIDCGDHAAEWATQLPADAAAAGEIRSRRAARVQPGMDARCARGDRVHRRLSDPGDFARVSRGPQFAIAAGAADGAFPAERGHRWRRSL